MSTETTSAVGRFLPRLKSCPKEPIPYSLTRIPPPRSSSECKRLAEALARDLRHRHDAIAPLCGTSEKLATALREADPGDLADPGADAAESLEVSEFEFRDRLKELDDARIALASTGGPRVYGPSVFAEVQRLSAMFKAMIGSLQEIRWALLIADGLRTPTTDREFTSAAALMEALDED